MISTAARALSERHKQTFTPALLQLNQAIMAQRDSMAPKFIELQDDFRQFRESDLAIIRTQMAHVGSQLTSIAEAVMLEVSARSALIERDWISAQRPGASLAAFAQMVMVAEQVKIAHPYDDAAIRVVSNVLGGWGQALPVSFAGLGVEQRITFAEQQGFDVGLLAIPVGAFPEAVGVAGIGGSIVLETSVTGARRVRKPSSASRDPNEIVSDGDHAHAFSLVRQVEQHFRKVLNAEMPKHFGPAWMNTIVHRDIRKKWLETQAKEKPPRSQDLLDYSDFGELLSIIQRTDVWGKVFESLFISPMDFEVSFKRLMFARNPLSHGRFITRHEYFICVLESERMLRAFGMNIMTG